MYKITAKAKEVEATILLPFSKSESNRALIMRALAKNAITIRNLSDAGDTCNLKDALANKQYDINTGEGGTTFRFMLAYCALTGEPRILRAGLRMSRRPISHLVEALNTLGAKIEYLESDGFAPVKINAAPLNKKRVIVDASKSSQFISALMLIAPYIPGGLTIHLKGKIVSSGYINLTARMMRNAGAKVALTNNIIRIAQGEYTCKHITISRDWSAAGYFFQAVMYNHGLQIYFPGLQLNSFQPDSKAAIFFGQLGIAYNKHYAGVRVRYNGKGGKIKKYLSINCLEMPDMAPTLALTLAAKGYGASLTGLQTLTDKETNRLAAIKTTLTNMGIPCTYNHNSIRWVALNCRAPVKPFDTFGDHRFVMCISMLSFIFKTVILNDTEAVTKSFPAFFVELKKTGVSLARC